MFRRFLITTAWLSFIASVGFSQIKVYKTIDVSDGLVHSSVECFFEDKDGYLWIGTSGGLNRWDGIEWLTFQTQHGLAGNGVREIIQHTDGRLFAATDEGVTILSEEEIIGSLSAKSGLTNNNVISICFDSQGRLYAGTWGGGVVIFANESPVDTLDASDGLTNLIIMEIWESAEGEMYFATWGGGVFKYKSGNITAEFNKNTGLVSDHIWDVLTVNDTLFVGTWRGLNVIINGQIIDEISGPRQDNFDIHSIFHLNNHRIYLGTDRGVFEYKTGGLQAVAKSENGLSDESIRCFWQLPNDAILLGTDNGGINFIRPDFTFSFNDQTGLRGRTVRAIYQDERENIYLGSNGISVLQGDRIVSKLTTTEGLPSNAITAISGDAEGRLYVGTFGGGVAIVSSGSVSKVLDLRNGLRTNRVESIYSGSDGVLYVGTWSGGVTLFIHDQFHKTLMREDGLLGDTVSYIFEASDGTIFFAVSGKGVSRYHSGEVLDPLTTEAGLPSNNVTAILERNDKLIFSTWGGGLGIYQNRSFQIIDTENGLNSNIIYNMIFGNNGHLYLNTANGVNVLDFGQQPVEVRTLTVENGMLSNNGARGILKDHLGRLWFGSNQGVTCISDYAVPINKVPQLLFKHVASSQKKWSGSTLDNPLTIKYDDYSLRFVYAGIDLTAPKKVNYKYRLDGLENGWQTTNARSVQYSSLDPGNYKFEIMAKTESGPWSRPKAVELKILPPFWQTPWFRALLLLVLIGVTWLIYRVRLTHVLKVEKLRTQIASDLHDDIGASLTHIALASERILAAKDVTKTKSHAERIGALSRSVIQTFSDIVWSIDARNDTMAELITRMKEYVHTSLGGLDIQHEFSVNNTDKDTALTVDLRQNIYLIFKEAINNVVKHASASSVTVTVQNNAANFTMEICDNGSVKSLPAEGNGLKNMRLRAERINGALKIEIDRGFTVHFERQPI